MKVNQTSSLAVPPHPLASGDAVALYTDDVTGVQIPVLTGTVMAPPQSSFAGGGGGVPIQTSNVVV